MHGAAARCEAMSKRNPRYANGAFRRKMRARLKAMGAACGICGGALGPIDYDAPSDHAHPLSFVIDERIPVSRWHEFGYPSPEACAQDVHNLQAAHWICNSRKGDKLMARQPERRSEGAARRCPTSGTF